MKRARSRGLSMLEVAALISIGGSLLAVAVPAFVRELHASKLTEATLGLARIGEGSSNFAALRKLSGDKDVFPGAAPLTPATPPRGKLEIDPPGTWNGGTWKALNFQPVPEGTPHAYAFEYESGPIGSGMYFVARAHGDLDGDSQQSTFEIRGTFDASGTTKIDPGMLVEAELE